MNIWLLSSAYLCSQYDRVVVEFGNIANPDTTRTILVKFSVTAVRTRMSSKIHHVTVGAEFDFETYVWVGQTEVTISPPKAVRLVCKSTRFIAYYGTPALMCVCVLILHVHTQATVELSASVNEMFKILIDTYIYTHLPG